MQLCGLLYISVVPFSLQICEANPRPVYTWKMGSSSGQEYRTWTVFWHQNKARGLDMDLFWVFLPRKKPCDGLCTGCVPAFGPNLSVWVKKSHVMGRVPLSVGVEKVGHVGCLPDVNWLSWRDKFYFTFELIMGLNKCYSKQHRWNLNFSPTSLLFLSLVTSASSTPPRQHISSLFVLFFAGTRRTCLQNWEAHDYFTVWINLLFVFYCSDIFMRKKMKL